MAQRADGIRLLSRRRRPVRVALFEAAHVIMTRVASWSTLKAWAMNVARRRGAKRAKVALARKLGVALHAMWVKEIDFRLVSASPSFAGGAT